MDIFVQQLIEGLASGAIYASLALAITLIHRSTGVANFAQGELATVSTYFAWQLTAWGVPIVPAIVLTLLAAFCLGAILEGTIVRKVEHADLLTIVIVTFGLFLLLNNATGLIWGHVTKSLPSPFPDEPIVVGGIRSTPQSIGTIAVLTLEVLALWFIFQKTKIGLAMRAAASNRISGELVGIYSGRIYMLGWGLAAALGALAGVLIAPRMFMEPNMMGGVLIYAFAAAALGGINSPVGAVVGSLIVGVTEALAVTYIPFLGADMKMVVPFAIIVLTLLVKPTGLFSTQSGARV